MDTDDLRSYRWNNSHSNSNKGATTSPKITSSLWKQLSEECDSVKTPGLHSSCLTENLSPSEKDVSFNSSSSASHSQDLWHTQQSPASGQSDVTFQVIHSDPWETLTNQTKASRDLTELSISNLTSSAFRQSDIDVNRIPKIGTEENTSSLFTKDVRYGKYEPGVIGTELNEPTNPASQLFPSHSYPPSSIWNENTEIPTNSSFPLSSSQNESFKLHNSLAWNNIMSSVPQRSVLHDIGNVNYPSVAAPASDFTCQKLPSSYNASAPELCDSQRTIAFHPQKQHTDLVALMQELSMFSETRNAGQLPHDGNTMHTYSHQKFPATTQVNSLIKGCVFCKNNNYHSTFYRSHTLKDERGHCQCPVLRLYVCPLCNATGDFAHTLKYCPLNTVTKGDPISAGLPPGKVTNWREVAKRMLGYYSVKH